MTVCFKVSEIPEKNRLTGALLYILQITTCVLIKGIELQPPDQQPDGNIVKTTFNIRSTKRAGKIMKKVDQWAFLAFLDMRQQCNMRGDVVVKINNRKCKRLLVSFGYGMQLVWQNTHGTKQKDVVHTTFEAPIAASYLTDKMKWQKAKHLLYYAQVRLLVNVLLI